MEKMLLGISFLLFGILLAMSSSGTGWLPLLAGAVGLYLCLLGYLSSTHWKGD